MSRQAHNDWLVLSPPFLEHDDARIVFREHATRLAGCLLTDKDDSDRVPGALSEALARSSTTGRRTVLRAALCVLTDLACQRWSIRVVDDGAVEVKRPDGDRMDPCREKARIRAQELVRRDEQLRQPATRKFIKAMERHSVHNNRFVSIFSLIRDGRELANSLRGARALPMDQRVDALQLVIDPYLQFVDDAEACPHTGLRLQDIWRYFRHTWTNQYTSTPGRSMAFLVRDRAREFHPVVGIGSLGSSIVQIRERDAWIGWAPEPFMEFASEAPSAELGVWLTKTVDTALDELFLDDFIEEQLTTLAELRAPTAGVVARLLAYGVDQRELHHRLARSQDLKQSPKQHNKNGSTEQHWRDRAQTSLYRSKRALALAGMLQSRMVLREFFGHSPTVDDVRDLFRSSDGRRIVKKVLRKAKANRVGIAMADITVCGAVHPYKSILGGKLVSMFASSPEVIRAYQEKYAEQESEIASSMAGRPIIRPAKLVLLGTTSLYGVGSSQYNRLRMPAEELGGRVGDQLEYVELGKSESYGTSHFSTQTVDALVSLVQQSSNGQRVNSIFGEGASPKLRKIREGLDALNLPTDALLRHGRSRIVYGVPLVRNLREFLLGMDDEPEYLFELEDPNKGTETIARWWSRRWLSKRIIRDQVLAQVEEHTLVRPVRHGARVMLPTLENGQGSLFDDLAY